MFESSFQELVLCFIVNEDVPSERMHDYRQLMIDGLSSLLPTATSEQRKMIDRVFWDWDRDPAHGDELSIRSIEEIEKGSGVPPTDGTSSQAKGNNHA